MFSTSKSLFRNPTGGGGGPTDPSFAYVPLLLNTTSTNGQQNNTFLDSSTNNFTITRNGTPTQGSITPYWPNGQWSNYFVAVNTIFNSSISSMNFGASTNFTIEAWVNWPAAAGANQTFFELTGTTRMILGRTTTGFRAYWNGPERGAAYTFAVGTWYHIAVVRNSGTVSFYINGSLLTSFSDTITWTGITRFNIGSNSSDFEPMTGYVSNLRVVNGTAVYTSAFTPPTSPLTAITNTQLLTCQSNRFRDNSTNNYTFSFVGTPRVQAFQPFSPTASYTTALYGGSGYFGGSTDSLSLSQATAFSLGTGDFTVEGWAYPTANPSVNTFWTLIDARGNISSIPWAAGARLVGGVLRATFFNGADIQGSIAVPLNTWTHLAFSRSGTTLRIFVNGVLDSTSTMSTNLNVTGTQYIGSLFDPNTGVTGYISNLRLVKGTAVYTGAFTPPTLAPLTTAGSTSAASYPSTTNVNTSFAASSTSLLLNFTNAGIYDAAVQNNAITVGNAQVSIAQSKWSPTSMAFDGNGDYLNIPSSQGLNLGTGSLTVEAWVYLSAMSGDYFIVSSTGAGGGFFGFRSGTDIGYGRTGIAWDYQAASGMVINNWYHVAWSRNGTSMRIFVNGSQVGATQTTSQAYDLSTTSTAVGSAGATLYLNGYIQDLRITRGIGRYTANFSVPTAAFPTR